MILDEALDLLDRCYHSPATNVVRAEVEQLRHDIGRYVEIAAEQAQEVEELRARLADAEALAIRRGDIQVRLQADLAAANEKLRAFEHYVMTGRNEQHDRLVADLEAARELPTAMANGYTAGSVTEHEFHSVHLHYNTRQQAVAAFEAISDAIDAAIAGEKK